MSFAAISTIVDGHYWQKAFIWPELEGILFNVVEGKSSEWGVCRLLFWPVHADTSEQTSPPHHYFTSALPKSLLLCYPLLLLSMITNRSALCLAAAPIASILLLSQLGHKEWRFMIYSVPLLNAAAVHGLLSW